MYNTQTIEETKKNRKKAAQMLSIRFAMISRELVETYKSWEYQEFFGANYLEQANMQELSESLAVLSSKMGRY